MQFNKKRNFNLMVLGQIISLFGSSMLRFALSLYVLDLTGRADIFATIFAVSSIPGIFLSPIGGAIADRFNRKNLMVIFDFCSSAIVLFFIFTLYRGNPSILFIGVIMTLLSVISTMYQPTVQANIPLLSEPENLVKANGIVNGISSLAGFAGPIIGGILYNFLGLNTLVIMSCIAFFLSAVMEIFIQIPFKKLQSNNSIIPTIASDMKKGFHHILKESSFVRNLIIIAAALNLLISPLFIIGSPFVLRITLQADDFIYGLSMGIIQLSSILGAVLIGKFEKHLRKDNMHRWISLVSVLLIPMALSLTPFVLNLGFAPSFAMFMGFSVPILMCFSIISIYALTVIQQETPNALLGKVMAITMAVSQIAAPLGQLIYGKLFQWFQGAPFIPVIVTCISSFLMVFLTKKMLPKQKLKLDKVTIQ